MFITKSSLACLHVLDDTDSRNNLSGFAVANPDTGHLYATDGCSLYTFPLGAPDLEDEYPEGVTPVSAVHPEACVVIPKAALAKAAKNLQSVKSQLPSLAGTIVVTVDENRKYLTTTDMSTTDTVQVQGLYGDLYVPNMAAVVSEAQQTLASEGVEITLSVEALETLVKTLKHDKNDWVKLTVCAKNGSSTPILAVPENGSFTGVIMPMITPCN